MRAAVRHATIAAVVVGFTAVVAAATDGMEVTARIVGIAIVAYSLGWWVWLLFLRGLLVRHGTEAKRTSRAGLIQIAGGGLLLLAGAALGRCGVRRRPRDRRLAHARPRRVVGDPPDSVSQAGGVRCCV